MRNPVSCSIKSLIDELQNELMGLHNDPAAKDIFVDKTIKEFWPLMIKSYPNVADNVLCALLPLASTYLC